jgi:hypothetical protein
LPAVGGATGVNFDDYLVASWKLRNLRNLTIQLLPNTTFDTQMHTFVRKSSNLEQLHLQYSPSPDGNSYQSFMHVTGRVSHKGALFTLATRMTFHGYDFRAYNSGSIVRSFPALHAMSMVDCLGIDYAISHFDPAGVPCRVVLMLKIKSTVSASYISRFICGLSCMRELIVHGSRISLRDGSLLTPHADSLQLLSLPEISGHARMNLEKDSFNIVFDSMTALHHLCVFTD